MGFGCEAKNLTSENDGSEQKETPKQNRRMAKSLKDLEFGK
jgi:hypothetical protein